MANFSMTKQKFQKQWLRHFAPDITKEQFEKHIKDQFIWHAFSWELVDTEKLLTGETARQAYNDEDKSECIFCDMFGNNGVTDKLSTDYDTAEKIDSELIEFYVVAQDYSWTYIKTHEGDGCGPYFLRNTY
jgi:hypothetical protein